MVSLRIFFWSLLILILTIFLYHQVPKYSIKKYLASVTIKNRCVGGSISKILQKISWSLRRSKKYMIFFFSTVRSLKIGDSVLSTQIDKNRLNNLKKKLKTYWFLCMKGKNKKKKTLFFVIDFESIQTHEFFIKCTFFFFSIIWILWVQIHFFFTVIILFFFK